MTHADALHKLMEWTATGSNGISTRQYQAWLKIFADYPPAVCMTVVDRYGPKYTHMSSVPMGTIREALYAIAPPKKKYTQASTATTTGCSRKISAWWGADGGWGGDWAGATHPVLVRVWAEMDYAALKSNRDRVDAFREVCITAGIVGATLDAARAARAEGEHVLGRFLAETYQHRR